MPKICIDAALCAALYIPEDATLASQSALAAWTGSQVELIAPDLWAYEVVAVVHKCIRRSRLSQQDGAKTLERIMALPVRLVRSGELHARALQLAEEHHLPAAYDAHYLAVAEMEGCEFWTLDERLYNTVHAHLSWVHLVGEPVNTAN